MRGVMMIFYYQKFLQTEEAEYDGLQEMIKEITKEKVIELKRKINS